ncbi:MAG: hypothetical protein KGO92_14835, partial [Bacteroidota bacterium]|nr:hypothetical protein [Bacteroidota bacterium]
LQHITDQDTVTLPQKRYLERNQLPKNGIPNKYTEKSLPPVYSHNNGKGFDVYGSVLDNMPMLMPDSGYVTGMPVYKPRSGTDSLRINKPYFPNNQQWKDVYPPLKPDTTRPGNPPYPFDHKKKKNGGN